MELIAAADSKISHRYQSTWEYLDIATSWPLCLTTFRDNSVNDSAGLALTYTSPIIVYNMHPFGGSPKCPRYEILVLRSHLPAY